MEKELTVFIVVGRLGKSLTVSKTSPFLASKYVKHVYVFRETEGFPIRNVSYITIPQYILDIKPKVIQRFVRVFYEFYQLLKYAIKLKPDYINGVGTKPKGWNSTIVSMLTGSKCIFSLIGGIVSVTTYYRFKWFWTRFNLWMIHRSAVVTTKGNTVKNYLIHKGIPESKIFILNGSLDVEKFKNQEGTEKDIDILFVGTFRRLKGPDRVLEVVKRLIDEGKNIKAVFLGKGYLFDDISQTIETMSLSNNINLVGHVDETVSFFKRAKVIIIPSRSEGLPTAMIEAMACECVPVVSNVGNITDAANHGVNACVVNDYMDIESFTKNAKYLLENDAKRNEMGKAGRDFIVSNYSVSKQAEIVDKIILATKK